MSQMSEKSVFMTFPRELVNEPVISRLIRGYNVDVNILQAQITPRTDGTMFAVFSGRLEDISNAIQYLEKRHVRLSFPAKRLLWSDSRCVSCGACVSRCIAGAFAVHPVTREVVFDSEKCIACKLCIPACSYGAIEPLTDGWS
jgi:ferredoxin